MGLNQLPSLKWESTSPRPIILHAHLWESPGKLNGVNKNISAVDTHAINIIEKAN